MVVKRFRLALAVLLIIAMLLLSSCSASGIIPIARESGSGTRLAFDSLVINSKGVSLNDRNIRLSKQAIVVNSEQATITKVAVNVNAIGYVSLRFASKGVKVISINSAYPTIENVQAGLYKFTRSFSILYSKSVAPSENVRDFLYYLNSYTAAEIVADEGYISNTANVLSENINILKYVPPSMPLDKDAVVIIKGSTSVENLMGVLIREYIAIYNSVHGVAKLSDKNFHIDTIGSSSGIKSVVTDTSGDVISMYSSNLSADILSQVNSFYLAVDIIAVIVNEKSSITNLTNNELFDIYTGFTSSET